MPPSAPAFAPASAVRPFPGVSVSHSQASHCPAPARSRCTRVPARMCEPPLERGSDVPPPSPAPATGPFSALAAWTRASAQRGGEKAAALRKYGLAAVLSYGMFDALTYSISFLFSLRAYLATGKTLTWTTLPQVLAFMWGINNFSRPFRIAGALALAPVVDRRVVKPVGRMLTRVRKGDSES